MIESDLNLWPEERWDVSGASESYETLETGPAKMYAGRGENDDCAYYNVATCPDCAAGMIRLGKCCACPSCGLESCWI
jgi:hypothetical protein